jgi:hypothetical protein
MEDEEITEAANEEPEKEGIKIVDALLADKGYPHLSVGWETQVILHVLRDILDELERIGDMVHELQERDRL